MYVSFTELDSVMDIKPSITTPSGSSKMFHDSCQISGFFSKSQMHPSHQIYNEHLIFFCSAMINSPSLCHLVK